jgi:Uma2 family endonuclease
MAATVTPALMTVEELLALPDEEGVERYLIRGQLRERRDFDVTVRNRWHTAIEALIAHLLLMWLEQQPEPRGSVHAGEVGCLIRRNPDTVVGIDVVYVSAEVAARQSDDTTLIDGLPTLAVEILSPSTTIAQIGEKIDEYLAAGLPLVWVVDPYRRTVVVYRPDTPPEMFNVTHELSGEPHLPGFRVPVARIFSR